MNSVLVYKSRFQFPAVLLVVLAFVIGGTGCEESAVQEQQSSIDSNQNPSGNANSQPPGCDANLVVLESNPNCVTKSLDYFMMSEVGEPSPRLYNTATWTGSELIVFGGKQYQDSSNNQPLYDSAPIGSKVRVSLNSGGIYNLSSNSWRAMSDAPEARVFHKSVWTGSQLIVFGGETNELNETYATGVLIYNLNSNTWERVDASGEPEKRKNHGMIWTGEEVFVWGGQYYINFDKNSQYQIGSGGLFNPVTKTWRTVSSVNAPSKRQSHLMAWTGQEVLVWGGGATYSNGSGGSSYLYEDTAKAYNPSTDSWRDLDVSYLGVREDGSNGMPLIGVRNSVLVLWGGSSISSPKIDIGSDVLPAIQLTYNLATDGVGLIPLSELPNFNSIQPEMIGSKYNNGAVTDSGVILWGIHDGNYVSQRKHGVFIYEVDK